MLKKMGNRFRDQYEGQLTLAYIVFIIVWTYLTITRLFEDNVTEMFWGIVMFVILLSISFSFIGLFDAPSVGTQKLVVVEPVQTRVYERQTKRNNHKQKVKKRKKKNNR